MKEKEQKNVKKEMAGRKKLNKKKTDGGSGKMSFKYSNALLTISKVFCNALFPFKFLLRSRT